MSEEQNKVSDELFKDVKFYVVGDIDEKVVQLLKAGKGKEVSYNALATHIIAEDGDNPEVGESREVFDLPVVKPSWVILSVRCGDLLPYPSAIESKIPPSGAKFECALKHPGIKIVTPDWITHSVKEKMRKDELLYHPRLTYIEPEEEDSEADSYDQRYHSDGSFSPRRSRMSSGGSSGEESSPRRRPGPKRLNSVSPSSPRKADRRSERMFDDSDDDSSTEKEGPNLNWTPAEVVTPTPPISSGTARRRGGPPGNKEPAPSTGSGLINLCVPVPEGVPGWSPAARTLRNITNNSDMQPANRPANVAHIIQNLTANQTKPLEQQTNQSHAQTPNIPQDGFLLGCVFAIADYPEQMADKQLLATWKRVIQACGGAVDPTLTSRCTHLLCESQVSSMYVQALREGKRCVTAHWLNTVLKRKRMVPPHRTLHLPFAFPPGAKPCSQHIISVTGFVDADRDDLKLMAYLAGARYTGYLCRSNTVLICKEPSGLKYEKAKEWKIPCVNAQWLCDILLGNFEALRQVQHSRYCMYTHPEPLVPNTQLVQNLLGAWRAPIKVSPEAVASLQLLHKQKMSDSSSQPTNKKARLEDMQSPNKKLPLESTPRVMFTGFEPAQVQQYTKRLHALGGEVADGSQKVSHLVACKVTRTVKFLSAMSVVKHIVSPEWLEESWRSQKFVDEHSYTLRDAEAEVLFGFSLEDSLKRAHNAPLFKGKYFYLTPGMCPSLSTMKPILESAGGKLLAKQPSYRKIMEHKQNKNLPEIILISCDNDLHLCREYFLKNIDVHNAEFILTGVLTQKLDYDSYPL
ncbi:PAX-interacting protein 1 [Dissostichus eleginoides]|uniref:PAX-interacting protein 1 n=1 Tax=Dissostichus eleginoides TaxID=100907 RepID=A0AAD9EVN6_DISEL|nr:PAX-interacting protein 1 [Dissostichus eleginoides]